MKKAVLALIIVASLTSQALAIDKWLDSNGTANADSGIAAASTITWATGTSNWNTASSGSGGAISGWTSGTTDRAFFAAGGDANVAYTVTLSAPLTAGSVFVEEGTITKSGSALTVNQIDIASGASFVYNASGGIVPTGTSPAVTLHGTGATFGYTAGGAGGTFLNTGMAIVLDGGGTLTDSIGNPNIYSGVISGTGDLVKTGPGILSITTTATYTGNTIVNGGTLRLRTGTPQIPNTALTVTGTGGFDVATFNQTVQSVTGTGNLPFSGAGTLTIAGTASTNYSGVWSGSGRINVNKSGGTGTLTLSGVNTATGRFTNTLGTTTVASGASLGGAVMDVVVDGGTLNLNNAAQAIEDLGGVGGTINLASGHVLTINATNSGSSVSYAGNIAGNGSIATASTATLTEVFSGSNSYAGTTSIAGAGIQFVNRVSMPNTAGTITNNITVASNGVLAVSAGGGTEWSNGTSGVGTIGGLIAGAGGQAGTTNQIAWSSGSIMGIDTTNAGGSLTYSGTIGGFRTTGGSTDNVGLRKLGTGTLVLDVANPYSGGTTVVAGTLGIGNNTALGTGSLTFAGGDIASSGGPRSIANNTVLAANGGISGTNNLTINGTFTNSGGNRTLTSTNTGTTTLAGNVFLSEVTGTGRTLSIGGTGAVVISGNVANFSGGAGTAGNVTIADPGASLLHTVTLSGNNTYTGNTTLNIRSQLNINSATALGTGKLIANATTSSTFDNTSGAAITLTNANNIDLSGGSPTFVGTNDLSFGNNTVTMIGANRTITTNAGMLTIGAIAQDVAGRGFTKAGAGTLVVTGSSSYGGATTVSGGTQRAANNNALGFGGATTTSVGATTVNGATAAATLDLSNGITVNEPVTLNGGANGANLINSVGSTTSILSGGVVAGVQFATAGTNLSTGTTVSITSGGGSGATATAQLGVTAATFTIAGGTTVYSAAPTVTISGGGGTGATATANLTSGVVSSITITNAGTGFASVPTIAFSGGTVTTAGTNPTGTGVNGNFQLASLTLTAAGSGYTSAPTVSLSAGNATGLASVLPSITLTGTNNNIGGAGNLTVKSVIGGTGSMTKIGAGTLQLDGTNTYTGTTTIDGGTLAANNTTGSATGSGAVTINNGGTLAGSGAVSGAVTVNSGGKLAPGNSIESLDVGQLSFAAGSSFVYELNSSAALNVAADLVNASGALSIAAGTTLAISDIAGAAVVLQGTKFTLISYAGAWNGVPFDTYADDNEYTIGVNNFTFDYNDTAGGVNFGGGPPSLSYVTIIANVPEPSAFLFGGLMTSLAGVVYCRRKYISRRAA